MSEEAPPDVDKVLAEVFGFSKLREGQQQVVDHLLAGRSSLAIFPTGGGKSLCYQLPALIWPGLTIVISPLLALMRDQVEALLAKGVSAARLDSTLGAEEVTEVYRQLRERELKLLYVAPERFANERFRKAIKNCRPELLAIDEAHCLSEWGHNFRPDYLRLPRISKRLRVKRCLALTATATPEVVADIRKAFQIDADQVVATGFRRENLALHVTPCSFETREKKLLQRVAGVEGSVIIYVTLQHTAESVAAALRREGHEVRAYHAGMRSEAREEVQEGFMKGAIRIVVATIAFGMGIDKSDIRAVLHYNLPKSPENYVQEVGRAGRDGAPAHCEVFACLDDLVTLENFIFSDTPDATTLKNALAHILLLGEDFDLSLYELSRSCDIKPAVLETLLTYLELDGWIEPTGSFFSDRAIRFTRNQESALMGHGPARQRFLRKLFGLAREERGWWERGWLIFPLAEIALEMGESPQKISKTFEWLEGHGDIFLKVTRVRKTFRRLREADSTSVRELSSQFGETFRRREERDLARLDRVVEFLSERECLSSNILAYFGEDGAPPCGICHVCRDEGVREGPLIAREVPELSMEDLELIQAVMSEREAALRNPRQLTRFLCGIASPASVASGLKRHRAFGILTQNSFQEVLATVEALGTRRL